MKCNLLHSFHFLLWGKSGPIQIGLMAVIWKNSVHQGG